MIKAILFDWHGVLDKVLLEGLFRILSRYTKVTIKELKNELGDAARQFALGNFTDGEFWVYIRDKTSSTPEQITELKEYINSVIPNKELWEFLKVLKKTYKLAIFSDCPLSKAKKIRENFDLGVFDEVFFSAEVHLDKKMAEFYQLVIKTLKIKNEEALLIDDSPKNIAFASALGLSVHHFTDTNRFKKEIY